jgi:DNA-directed RNA polymerase subunit RPC12/RpoP
MSDLRAVHGLRYLIVTPSGPKSPKNDVWYSWTETAYETPKIPKSPNNDVSNVCGVKQLTINEGVWSLPKMTCHDCGVRRLMKSSKNVNSPVNDLTLSYYTLQYQSPNWSTKSLLHQIIQCLINYFKVANDTEDGR